MNVKLQMDIMLKQYIKIKYHSVVYVKRICIVLTMFNQYLNSKSQESFM